MARVLASLLLVQASVADMATFEWFGYTCGGGACGAMDDNEACAISAANCVGGCTGDSAAKIGAFMTCNEEGWVENSCPGGDARSESCVKSSGIDEAAYKACKADPSKIAEIHNKIDQAGAFVTTVPEIKINGNNHMFAQDLPSLKSALCDEGVTAACGSMSV